MKSALFTRAARIGAAAVGSVAALLASSLAMANPQRWQLNMPVGVTETSRDVYQLHMITLWICVAIGVLVFGAMFYAMFRFRKSKGAVAAKWSHNLVMEAIWTTIPILILIGCAWPATNVLVKMADTTNADMVVQITGYQWKWRYDYKTYYGKPHTVGFISKMAESSNEVRQLRSGLDPASVKVGDVSTYLLDVDNPLVLPAGVKVQFVITADDVIHSWWVPVLGWKQDAIPGMINSTWTKIDEPGLYRGQCAELCGKDHGFMPSVVKVLPKAECETWLDEREAALAPPPAAAPAAAPAPAAEPTSPDAAPATTPETPAAPVAHG